MAKRTQQKPTTVILVRHGRTPTTGQVLPGQAKGLFLSSEGEAQAEAAAKSIASVFTNVAAIYASPLERTKQTATPIANALGLKLKTDKRLMDGNTGEWTGLRLKDLAKLPEWSRVQHNPSMFRFPGGESLLEMQARANAAVSEIVDKHTGETIVVVSHADPIKSVIATALGSPLDMFQRIDIVPCSISVVTYGSTPQVHVVGATNLEGRLA